MKRPVKADVRLFRSDVQARLVAAEDRLLAEIRHMPAAHERLAAFERHGIDLFTGPRAVAASSLLAAAAETELDIDAAIAAYGEELRVLVAAACLREHARRARKALAFCRRWNGSASQAEVFAPDLLFPDGW